MASGCWDVALLLLACLCFCCFLARSAALRCARLEMVATEDDELDADEPSSSCDIINAHEGLLVLLQLKRCPRGRRLAGGGGVNGETP